MVSSFRKEREHKEFLNHNTMIRFLKNDLQIVGLRNGKMKYSQNFRMFSTVPQLQVRGVDTRPYNDGHESTDRPRFIKQDRSSLDYVALLDSKLRELRAERLSTVKASIHANVADLYSRRYREALEVEGTCEQMIINSRIATWSNERSNFLFPFR